MKYILIIIAVAVLVCSCTDMSQYVPVETYTNEVALYESQLEKANDTIGIKDSNIADLEEEVGNLENDLNLTGVELEKYRSLVNNLNELLSNIYIGYAENENYISDGFTAFSMEYKGKYYLITAGHCIHYNFEGLDTGLYTTIKFKQGNGSWIFPKLLTYENDYYRDYAILYSDKIDSGLAYDLNNSYPEFILGNRNLNTIKNVYDLKDGESGSPIIDLDGQVIRIATGNFVDIDLVIETINNLK